MKNAILVGCSIIVSALLYHSAFGAYFFQDDWFSLRISNAQTVIDVLRFFLPRTDVIYYRPLGMQLPYFILQRLFGLQPLAFHGMTFLFHALNTILIYRLLRRFDISGGYGALGAFFYAVSTVHYLPMYWTATSAFIAGPTYILGSCLAFLSFLSNRQYRYYGISLVLFILGLCTYEIAAVLPMLLGIYGIYTRESWRNIPWLLPYIACAGTLFLLRFVVYAPPLSGAYTQAVGVSTLQNVKGYVLWSLQWPEEITAQFVTLFHLNPQFISDFRWFLTVQLIAMGLFFLTMLILIVMASRRQGVKAIGAVMLFSGAWFLIGILPVIFFVGHSFSYYLPVSLIGLIYCVVYIFQAGTAGFSSRLLPVFGGVMAAIWLVAGINTIAFNTNVHWAPRRAKLAASLVQNARRVYPPSTLHPQSIIYVSPSSENKLSLNNQDGLVVLYERSDLITVYGYDPHQESL